MFASTVASPPTVFLKILIWLAIKSLSRMPHLLSGLGFQRSIHFHCRLLTSIVNFMSALDDMGCKMIWTLGRIH